MKINLFKKLLYHFSLFKIELLSQSCVLCHQKLKDEFENAVLVCNSCKNEIEKQLLLKEDFIFEYSGLAKKLLLHLKDGKVYVAKLFAFYLMEFFKRKHESQFNVIFVSCNKKNKLKRGYDQVYSILKELKRIDLERNYRIFDLIDKRTKLEQKFIKTKAERMENVKGKIFLKKQNFKSVMKNMDFYLLDDIISSESTVKESINTLKYNGINRVKPISIFKPILQENNEILE